MRHCVIPPFIMERLARSADPEIRRRALANIALAATLRARRGLAQAAPGTPPVVASPAGGRHRLVYDAGRADRLPGRLVRAEGQGPGRDPAVNEAYDHSGTTFDFFSGVFGRNSLDDRGMTLVSSVHMAEAGGMPMNNAFWNGEQMAYGDGDGILFERFTRSVDVVGHELTHGVESFTSNLEYHDEPGALNEHFADVFGALVRQWRNGETALEASWVIGAEVLVPAPTRRGIRDMEFPGTAFTGDPDLGSDPQPAHLSKMYRGPADSGGVHINSGIPNRAFVLFAKKLGGNAWDIAGRVWYDTLRQLTRTSRFHDCARLSLQAAGADGAAARNALRFAWGDVGIDL